MKTVNKPCFNIIFIIALLLSLVSISAITNNKSRINQINIENKASDNEEVVEAAKKSNALNITETDVIIIGAGASGITSSYYLESNNINNIVLEARNRIGGRINTDTSFGYPLELGAIHITHQSDNPMYSLAKLFNLNLKKINMGYKEETKYINGKKLNSKDVKILDKLNNKVHTKWTNFVIENIDKLKGKTLYDSTVFYLKQSKLSILEKLLTKDIVFGSNINSNSIIDEYYDYIISKSKGFTIDCSMTNSGYVNILDILTKNLDIRLEKKIIRIKQEQEQNTNNAYSIDNKDSSFLKNKLTEVTDENRNENNLYSENKVIIYDSNNNIYKAKYVIVTVPLGVLKSNMIEFIPALSSSKQNSIDKLEMFDMNKIFVEFTEKFWEETNYINLFYNNKDDFYSKYSYIINMSNIINKNVLLFMISNKAIDDLTDRSEEVVKKEIIDLLKLHYPDKNIEITQIKITDWGNDEFSKGAFSELGADKKLRKAFQEKEGRIFFAGEHTMENYNAYVYGAIKSGLRIGKKVKEELEKELNKDLNTDKEINDNNEDDAKLNQDLDDLDEQVKAIMENVNLDDIIDENEKKDNHKFW